MSIPVRPDGTPPPGATHDPNTGATTFALRTAEEAESVEVCLFDDSGRQDRIYLTESINGMRFGTVTGVPPGTRYGFRVHGPWSPERGQRFNGAKLLVDPYARAITGSLTVKLHPAAGTALPGEGEGKDYAGLPAEVTFADGETSKTIEVLPFDDGVTEPLETVVAYLKADAAYKLSTT